MDGWIIEGLSEVCGWWGFWLVMGVVLSWGVKGWNGVCGEGGLVCMLNWVCATQHSMTRFAQGSEACLHAFQMWECAKVSFHCAILPSPHPSLSSSFYSLRLSVRPASIWLVDVKLKHVHPCKQCSHRKNILLRSQLTRKKKKMGFEYSSCFLFFCSPQTHLL